MALVPLEQWFCDECGGLINGPSDGYVEWLTDDEQLAHGFRIVHHVDAAPSKKVKRDGQFEGCYLPGNTKGLRSMKLGRFIGEDGLVTLLQFLDHGHIDPEDEGPWVRSAYELAELIRRLQVPNYEEARKFWSLAVANEDFDGANEVSPYTQKSLKKILGSYRGSLE